MVFKNELDKQYYKILSDILSYGTLHEDPNREGVKRMSIPKAEISLEYSGTDDLMRNFPLLTLKKTNFHKVVSELLWFLRGETGLSFLHNHNNHIWDINQEQYYDRKEFAEKDSLGKVYGHQWRNFGGDLGKNNGIDQISLLIKKIRHNIHSSSLVVSSWNAKDIFNDELALPPCHHSFQIMHKYVNGELGFVLSWNQRSTDVFLGLPFNIASYALLAILISKTTGYPFFGLYGEPKNVHLYDNAITPAINIVRKSTSYVLPTLDLPIFTNIETIEDTKLISPNDFTLRNYKSGKYIRVKML